MWIHLELPPLQDATGIAADNTAQKTEEGKAAAAVKKVPYSPIDRFATVKRQSHPSACPSGLQRNPAVSAQDETKEQLDAARSHAQVKTVCCPLQTWSIVHVYMSVESAYSTLSMRPAEHTGSRVLQPKHPARGLRCRCCRQKRDRGWMQQ